MKRLWMSGAAAVFALSIASVYAQSTGSQDPPTQPPQTQAQPATPAAEGTTTLRGCVYEEKNVPGRSPNVAERAGVLEDYILVTEAPAATGTSGTAGAAGTAGMSAPAGKAFKLEKIADEQLKAVVGKMVEVTGKVDAERSDTAASGAATGTAGAPARDKNLGPDKIELPEFEVTSIKAVEGTCPATPNIKK